MEENNKDEQRKTVRDKREQDDLLMEESEFPEEVRKALHEFSERILVEIGPVRFPT